MDYSTPGFPVLLYLLEFASNLEWLLLMYLCDFFFFKDVYQACAHTPRYFFKIKKSLQICKRIF